MFLNAPDGIEVRDNAVFGNDGHGIYINSQSTTTSGNATLFNNVVFAEQGWSTEFEQTTGVYFACGGITATLTIRNLTIADHADYGLYIEGDDDTTVNIYNSIIWDNDTSIELWDGAEVVNVTHSDIEGGWAGTGNLNTDPYFVTGPSSGYFFLSQTAAGEPVQSPCVDAGLGSASSWYPLGSGYSTRTDAVEDAGTIDMGFHYLKESATYVDLDSFEAKGQFNRVLLSWTTGAEVDNAGFDIYRVKEGSDAVLKVNSKIIAAQGTAASGFSYSFIDTSVVNGATYSYYLVDIDTSGEMTVHGPVNARPYTFVERMNSSLVL